MTLSPSTLPADDTLLNLSREMRTQNNRCTQHVLFVVMEDVRHYCGHDGNWSDRERKSDPDLSDLCEQCAKLSENDESMPDDCDDCCSSAFDYFTTEQEPNLTPGVFFTAKACEEHIAENHYHYKNARSWGIGAWRNPEMQVVMQHLLKMTGEDIPSHYR